jgi:membrane protease YdiL (CAAX protease family)
MEQAADDPWLIALFCVNALGSAAAWGWILWKSRRDGEVLRYEPRRSSPWGPGAAVLAIVYTLLALLAAFSPAAVEPAADNIQSEEIASRIAGWLLWQLLLCGGFFLVIALVYRATLQDFGLPRSGREALLDVAIGIVTCFAAFIPVWAAQGFLQWLIGREDDVSQHQLIQMITGADAPGAWVMLLACLSTVLVAPLCEEITYRLLFQGWLEKSEDEIVRIDADGGPDEFTIQAWNTTLEDSTKPLVMIGPARRGLGGLPHGWAPILISALTFGLAHAGYGPEPVPLFLFAILLGYVFQRTNRILPCIVAHATFNAATMLALWRIVVLESQWA